MAKLQKAKEKPQVRDSFSEAAAECNVSVAELKVYLIDHAGPTRWANWKSGKEPIPKRLLLSFLMRRQNPG